MKSKEERRRELEERIKEINEQIPAMLEDIRNRPKFDKPAPGLFFYAQAGEEIRDLYVLRKELDGRWLCALGSIEVSEADQFDLVLQPGDWEGGFPYMIELWNTVLIEEHWLDKPFYEGMTPESVRRALELYELFEKGATEIPHLLEWHVGEGLDLLNYAETFERQEREHMRKIKIRYGFDSYELN